MGTIFHNDTGGDGNSLTKANWNATGATDAGRHLIGPTVSVGDLPYAAYSATTGVPLSTLAIGTANQILTVSAGLPYWSSSIQLSYVTTNATYSGIVVSATSSIAVTAGQVGFLNSSGQFASGCATVVAKLPVTLISLANVASGAAGVFLAYGTYANSGFNLLVAGSPFYAATGVGIASISSASPATGTSGCIQRLGTAYSATSIFFDPSLDVYELV